MKPILYRGKNCKVGLTDWYQADREDFIQLLKNQYAYEIYHWFEVKSEKGHFKVFKNYTKKTWWFQKQ